MAALGLLRKLSVENTVLPAQTLGELYNVLVRKAAQSRAEARLTVLGWIDAFPVAETSPAVAAAAIGLATDHRLGIWDAVILARLGSGGLQIAAFGRSAGWLHLEWAYRNEPFLFVAARAARGVA